MLSHQSWSPSFLAHYHRFWLPQSAAYLVALRMTVALAIRKKRASLCSPTLQSLNTETTEDLSELCVKFFLVTEALLVREEILARRQEVWEQKYRGRGRRREEGLGGLRAAPTLCSSYFRTTLPKYPRFSPSLSFTKTLTRKAPAGAGMDFSSRTTSRGSTACKVA